MYLLHYFGYVCRHKWFVFVGCIRYGLVFRGIVHDWHKFLPSEFFPYARYFYMFPKRTKPEVIQDAFDKAWLLHQHRSRHHWQSWLLRNDSGNIKRVNMPRKYILEMVADWKGAGRAIHGEDDVLRWYKKNAVDMDMHPDVRLQVAALVGIPFKDRFEYSFI